MKALVVAPLSHAAGVHAFCLLSTGASLEIMRGFDANAILRTIESSAITHLWLPPTALYLLLDHHAIGSYDLRSLRSLVIGAAAVSPQRLREAVHHFGRCVSVNYSQIESGFLTWLHPDTLAAAVDGVHPSRLRSSGTSLFVSRVAIMNSQGGLLGPGENGEIVVRGLSVKRYLDRRATQQSRSHGWYHTGDIGYVDEDGYLYVTGRQRDVVVTSGLKVSAAEIEEVIQQLSSVRECAVVAVPDAVRGEVALAILVPRDTESPQRIDVLRHCRQTLGVQRAPRIVEYWAELPKNGAGKVDKAEIRRRVDARVRGTTGPDTRRDMH